MYHGPNNLAPNVGRQGVLVKEKAVWRFLSVSPMLWLADLGSLGSLYKNDRILIYLITTVLEDALYYAILSYQRVLSDQQLQAERELAHVCQSHIRSCACAPYSSQLQSTIRTQATIIHLNYPNRFI